MRIANCSLYAFPRDKSSVSSLMIFSSFYWIISFSIIYINLGLLSLIPISNNMHLFVVNSISHILAYSSSVLRSCISLQSSLLIFLHNFASLRINLYSYLHLPTCHSHTLRTILLPSQIAVFLRLSPVSILMLHLLSRFSFPFLQNSLSSIHLLYLWVLQCALVFILISEAASQMIFYVQVQHIHRALVSSPLYLNKTSTGLSHMISLFENQSDCLSVSYSFLRNAFTIF